MKVPIQVIYDGVRDIIRVDDTSDQLHRSEGEYTSDPRVYLDDMMQPRGISEEFKARNEIKAGIFLCITPNKNADWINYITFTVTRNY